MGTVSRLISFAGNNLTQYEIKTHTFFNVTFPCRFPFFILFFCCCLFIVLIVSKGADRMIATSGGGWVNDHVV